MMIELIAVYGILIADPIGAISIIAILQSHEGLVKAPKWHRLGLSVIAAGLIGQFGRNIYYLQTGISPSDLQLPLWVLKDYGIVILAVSFWVVARKGGRP